MAPRIVALLEEAIAAGQLGGDAPDRIAEIYFGLLIGDQQIRRVTGAMPGPDAAAIEARAETATVLLRRVFPTG